MGRYGGKDINKIRKGNPRHTHDALIAATSQGQADVLVTGDRTLLSRVKEQKLNVEIWNPQQFFNYVLSL